MAPREKVWEALVDPDIIGKWGAGPAMMSEKEGSEFSIWGGDIHGKNIEVKKGEKLVQEWQERDWAKHSIVTFRLTHKDGCTTLFLTHKDVPEEESKDIDKGWDDYYLGQIKMLLES